MCEYFLRNIELFELKSLYHNIMINFAEGEYPPYRILYRQIKKKVQTGLMLCDTNRDIAYTICADKCDNGFVLISLFLVYEQLRRSGYGTTFLNELSKYYHDKKGIIVEVERPEDSTSEEERNIREKRIEFYKKAGFILLSNVDYVIWEVPMYLMVMPQNVSFQDISKDIDKIMYEIYLDLMGKCYMHKLKLRVI